MACVILNRKLSLVDLENKWDLDRYLLSKLLWSRCLLHFYLNYYIYYYLCYCYFYLYCTLTSTSTSTSTSLLLPFTSTSTSTSSSTSTTVISTSANLFYSMKRINFSSIKCKFIKGKLSTSIDPEFNFWNSW